MEPLLVAEVAYDEITEAGTLGQPSLQGFCTDLNPDEMPADEDLRAILDRRPPQLRIRQMW